MNDGGDCHSERLAMEQVDAMADFLAKLEQLGPHTVELQRWGTSVDLQVQGLTRDEYDSFDGEDRYFPPTKERAPFWSKKIIFYESIYDTNHDLFEGGVCLTLYTAQPPSAHHPTWGEAL